jgi:hypothetical protein
MAEENKLRSFKDLHSAMAVLAAKYVPIDEIKDYFSGTVPKEVIEEIEGKKAKPAYHISRDERGLIERVVFRLVEKKSKTVGTGVEAKTVEESASASILRAAREDIPRILAEAEDLAELNPSNINPNNVQPFLTHAKELIMQYLTNNKGRLKHYWPQHFDPEAKSIEEDPNFAGLRKIDAHVETQVRTACKKKIRLLEDALHAADEEKAALEAGKTAEAQRTAEYVAQLESDNQALKTDKESLESATAVLTADKERLEAANGVLVVDKEQLAAEKSELEEEQAEFGPAYDVLAHENLALSERIASLEADNGALKTDKESLESAKAVLTAYKERLEAANSALTAEKSELEEEQLQMGHAWRNLSLANETLRSRAADVERQNSDLQSQNTNLRESNGRYARENQTLSGRVKNLGKRLASKIQSSRETEERLKTHYEQMLKEQGESLGNQIIELTEESAEMQDLYFAERAEKSKALQEKEKFEEAYKAVRHRYEARITELGTMVTEWYAFTEDMFKKDKKLGKNKKLQEVRSKNKRLAGLVSGLLDEVKSGERLVSGRTGIVDNPWREPAKDTSLALAEEELRHSTIYDMAKSEFRREIWGLMYTMCQENASYEFRQGVYERFLSTDPKDNMIRFAVHNNLGVIFYKHRADYESASRHYHEAEAALQKEREQNPGNKAIPVKLAEVEHNLQLCEQRLAA